MARLGAAGLPGGAAGRSDVIGHDAGGACADQHPGVYPLPAPGVQKLLTLMTVAWYLSQPAAGRHMVIAQINTPRSADPENNPDLGTAMLIPASGGLLVLLFVGVARADREKWCLARCH